MPKFLGDVGGDVLRVLGGQGVVVMVGSRGMGSGVAMGRFARESPVPRVGHRRHGVVWSPWPRGPEGGGAKGGFAKVGPVLRASHRGSGGMRCPNPCGDAGGSADGRGARW